MKEWYLIDSHTKPNMIGGYENQAFVDYKDDAFTEALTTDIADTVIIYNYDLSEAKEVRCIVQGNVADTQLKSLERTVLFPVGTVKAGQYVYFQDNYWLITGYPGNNKVYEKVTVSLCQYLLRWQNSDGKIIERWITFTSASKYDDGEKESKLQTLVSDSFLVKLPNDYESLNIDGKRVFIDMNKRYPRKVYKITRNNDALYEYGINGGILNLIADRNEYDPDKDNPELMLCDYIPTVSPLPTPPIDSKTFVRIEGEPHLKLGRKKTYKACFTDENSLPIAVPTGFKWNVICGFNEALEREINGSSISFLIENEDCIDERFALQVLVDGNVVCNRVITVTGIYGN